MSRNIKPISFSKADEDILDYLDTIDDKFSTYIKKLIRQDMYRTGQDTEVKELIKTINKLLDSGNLSINGGNGGSGNSNNADKPPVSKKQTSAIGSILGKR